MQKIIGATTVTSLSKSNTMIRSIYWKKTELNMSFKAWSFKKKTRVGGKCDKYESLCLYFPDPSVEMSKVTLGSTTNRVQ